MATINNLGNITARCPGCEGALASYEWRAGGNVLGVVVQTNFRSPFFDYRTPNVTRHHRLYKCGGCGKGGFAIIDVSGEFPTANTSLTRLFSFAYEVKARLAIPEDVPEGIRKEFYEGEVCLNSNSFRAAAAMFRSVLDKTMRANGYKLKNGTTLEQQIDLAAKDGVITAARQKRAHEDLRVLGNDVLHGEWRAVTDDEAMVAHEYAARVLHDFYDDRETVLQVLRAVKPDARIPDEDKIEVEGIAVDEPADDPPVRE